MNYLLLAMMMSLVPLIVYGEAHFAFSNEKADQLLIPVTKAIPKVGEVKEGICSNNTKIGLGHKNFSAASKKSTMRQTTYNFHENGGEYFNITSGKITSQEVCLLSDTHYFSDRKLLKVTSKKEDCTAEERKRVSLLKNRKLQWCHRISELQGIGHLFFAQFDKVGKQDLAVFGFISPGKLLTKEYSTDFDEWRADGDDKGKFPYKELKIFFANQNSDKKLGLAIEWPGAEGNNLELLAENGAEFKVEKSGYFYWSPL